MAQYNYKAMDKNGKAKKGSIEAINLDKAKEKLKSEGLIVQDIKEQGAGKKGGGKKVKDKDLAVFCKQFSAVLNAGVTIISALEMMSEQLENKTLKRALQEAQSYVQKGGTLADAFKLNPKVFPPIMINMTAAGEMSGNLEICFDRLTTHFETANALHSKVKVGQYLGAGELEQAKDADNKMIVFSVFCCILVAAVMFVVGRFFPHIYNTTDEIKKLATAFMSISALLMPICSMSHTFYFTLRSGGKTLVTFLFDSVFTWVIVVPCAYVLAHFTGLGIVSVYFFVQATELIKATIGFFMVKSDVWLVQMV